MSAPGHSGAAPYQSYFSQNPWSPKNIFWTAVDVVTLYFRTLVDPTADQAFAPGHNNASGASGAGSGSSGAAAGGQGGAAQQPLRRPGGSSNIHGCTFHIMLAFH